jgi:hypothetical protein
MDWIVYPFSILAGLILRIGIPIIITLLLIWVFRRLDEHWQQENVVSKVTAKNPGCWKIMGCSEEKRAKCGAHSNPDVPCWQFFRTKDSRLREGCIGCKVFREAAIPIYT